MRKITEALRLHFEHDRTNREIAQAIGTSPTTVGHYRACLGVLRLAKGIGNDRLNAACARALKLNAAGYRSIHSILKNSLDKQPPAIATQAYLPLDHANVRGPDYYH